MLDAAGHDPGLVLQARCLRPRVLAMLRDVPPVLLSECVNDLRAIAAGGTGYDPQWREKTGFEA